MYADENRIMEHGGNGLTPSPLIKGVSQLGSSTQAIECAVVLLDRAACVTSWNSVAVHLFGYSARTAVGKPFYHFLDLDSLTPGSVEWELSTAYYRGMSMRSWQYVHRNGSRFRATAEITPLWDGEFSGYKVTLNGANNAN